MDNNFKLLSVIYYLLSFPGKFPTNLRNNPPQIIAVFIDLLGAGFYKTGISKASYITDACLAEAGAHQQSSCTLKEDAVSNTCIEIIAAFEFICCFPIIHKPIGFRVIGKREVIS